MGRVQPRKARACTFNLENSRNVNTSKKRQAWKLVNIWASTTIYMWLYHTYWYGIPSRVASASCLMIPGIDCKLIHPCIGRYESWMDGWMNGCTTLHMDLANVLLIIVWLGIAIAQNEGWTGFFSVHFAIADILGMTERPRVYVAPIFTLAVEVTPRMLLCLSTHTGGQCKHLKFITRH